MAFGTIKGAHCPGCAGELTYRKAGGESEHPDAHEVGLCVRCVAMALCTATVAQHGDIGMRPESHNYPGHQKRMEGHTRRLRQLVRRLDREKATGVEAKEAEVAEDLDP